MDYINLLFKKFVVDQKENLLGWENSYLEFLKDTEKIKAGLLSGISIDNDALYINCETIGEPRNYENFLRKLIAENSNGISSDQRSTNAIKGSFKHLLADISFQAELSRTFLDIDKSSSYLSIRKWWKNFCDKEGKLFYKTVINRAVAAIHPECVSSTINEDNFQAATLELQSSSDYIFDMNKNWFERNVELTSWLDLKLKDDLEKLEPTDLLSRKVWRNIFVWEVYENGTQNLFNLNKQFIKYGSPGTGKTYSCDIETSNHFNNWKTSFNPTYTDTTAEHTEIVQFHPSITYEDFIEGLRPVVDTSGKTIIKLVNGVFKSFCKRAYRWEKEIYEWYPALKGKWEEIIVRDVKVKVTGIHWEYLKTIDDDVLLHKVIPPYYFIIDEINRAELSRVLGELMYCLEYRGYKGKIKTQYAQLATDAETLYWQESGQNYFFIPNNVYVLGTMNTIDRSVESFDFALRRRFRWIEVHVNYNLLYQYHQNKNCIKFDPIVDNLKALNSAIKNERLLGKDFQIGHSYLMKLNTDLEELNLHDYRNSIWSNHIYPLLEEYLRGSTEPSEISNKLENFKTIFFKN